jgi:hypothetical protein
MECVSISYLFHFSSTWLSVVPPSPFILGVQPVCERMGEAVAALDLMLGNSALKVGRDWAWIISS